MFDPHGVGHTSGDGAHFVRKYFLNVGPCYCPARTKQPRTIFGQVRGRPVSVVSSSAFGLIAECVCAS
jgi:hypothetical protein